MRDLSACAGLVRARDAGRRLAPVLVCLLVALGGCTVDPGPLVAPGTVVASDPSVRWVARIAWSGDGDELAFLGTGVGGPTLAYRAALDDASTSVSVVDGVRDATELRYLPSGRDLVMVGGASDGAGAGACEWAMWYVERDEWRTLGPAREGVGAFPRGQVPRWSIVVVDVDTGRRTLAYRGAAFVDVPAVAPDDRSVAFAVDGVIYRKALP